MSGWSAVSSVSVSLNMPLPANGQSYWHTYTIPSPNTGNMSIGFDIVGGNTWEVDYIQPGTTHGVMASGPTPPYGVTVQFTWTLVGVPSGFNDTGGSFTNGASSSVNVSSNPNSWYTTNSWNYKSGSHARTYQVRVDFFSATGANISSSTFQLTARHRGGGLMKTESKETIGLVVISLLLSVRTMASTAPRSLSILQYFCVSSRRKESAIALRRQYFRCFRVRGQRLEP